MSKKVKHLVVDTTAFIKAANLQNIAESVYTIQEVIDEITNDRQRRKLVVLPYDLQVKDVFVENIKFVTEFSKKTGDYTSLSATDIKVMALTYQIEKEKVGTEHLKTEPTMQKTVKVTGIGSFNLNPQSDNNKQEDKSDQKIVKESQVADTLGSDDVDNKLSIKSEDSVKVDDDDDKNRTYNAETVKVTSIGSFNLPPQRDNNKQEDKSDQKIGKESQVADTLGSDDVDNKLSIKSEDSVKVDDDDDKLANEIAEQINNMDLADGKDVEELMAKVSDEEDDSEEDTESEEDSDSDGGEWITPGNLSEKRREMDAGEFEDKTVEVACITSDFAMQNVLKQIGLNVTAIDGRVIKQLRTFIFRCTTCFKTTSVMTKLFCPKCGHATLKKVGVSIDEEGNQHIHINGRKPLTARGKKFSLPTPKGGQHFQYPILTEDQHIHKRFATKMARNKTNALDPDYIAGFSPFVMKDVNSKSAVLGVRANKQDLKYWMKNYSKGKKK